MCCPFDAGRTDADVTGEDNNVRVGLRWIEIGKLRVQVAEYMKFRCDNFGLIKRRISPRLVDIRLGMECIPRKPERHYRRNF